MLAWHEGAAGDLFYIPANTVHAIGGGVSLLEVQQNSDITYRLYDYGGPRELHLEQWLAVARGAPHPEGCRATITPEFSGRLADGPHFRLERVVGLPDDAQVQDFSGNTLVMPVSGEPTIAGETVGAWQCGLAPDVDAIEFSADATVLLTQPCRT